MFIRKESGVGLIEVLVALLVLSTSLLALATLQAKSLQYTHSTYLRSQANIYAYDILERVRINRTNFSSYQAATTDPVPVTAVTTPLASADLYEWRKKVADNFANGQAGIVCDSASSVCTVTIQWSEANTSGISSEDSTQFIYSTKI